MAQGNQPGADFLELSSDDDSDWLDENETRNFEDVERSSKRTSNRTLESPERYRGRERDSEYLTALPPFNQMPAHDSGAEDGSLPMRRPPSQARQLSLRRYNKATVVHNRGSPRSSLLSNASSDVIPRPLNVSRTVSQNLQDTPERNPRHSDSTQGTHQRNISEVESIRMNAFWNAHYATLHAIDPQPSSPEFSPSHPIRQTSGSDGRHIRMLAPIQTTDDPNRPPHLPAHFIRTPYPFTPKKEFPPPRTRPRRAQEDVLNDLDNKKGMHMLGMANDDDYDYRNRLERNMDAQGLVRSPTDATTRQVKRERRNSSRSTNSARETVVWLSLRHNSRYGGVADQLEHVTIPSSLVTSELKVQPSPTLKPKIRHIPVDFDDMYLAQELRSAYQKLSGPWIMRTLSANRLKYIKLSQVSAWSGSYVPLGLHEEAGTLLAARGGLATLSGSPGPFTEHGLLELYRKPKSGKARYTWVHWARRIAAANRLAHAQSDDGSEVEDDPSREITTIQFVHAFSPAKIMSVLALMMILALAATLLYIFFGKSVWRGQPGRERAERVTPGMLVGLFVGCVEGVVFVAWMLGSWMWL